MSNDIKYTSLYNEHLDLNAKMLPFAGYYMPINYPKGIQFEYDAVRNDVGMFDVSHMGEIIVSGNEASSLLQIITVNNIKKMNPGDAQYNAICNDRGGIKDDIIIYNNNDSYILIVNASNCNKIFNWMQTNNKYECIIEDKSDSLSLIAIQGPQSRKILEILFKEKINLKFYKHKKIDFNNDGLFVSRTGYTGELGFELLGSHHNIKCIWKKLISYGISACGLAVRDILRMEMNYCLYGNDISEKITPIEAGLSWIVEFKKDFIGKNVLLNQKSNGLNKQIISFEMLDKCIPRKGYKILVNDIEVGEVTSGTYSLGLKKGIGIGFINSNFFKKDLEISLNVRGKNKKGIVITPPFLKETSLHV